MRELADEGARDLETGRRPECPHPCAAEGEVRVSRELDAAVAVDVGLARRAALDRGNVVQHGPGEGAADSGEKAPEGGVPGPARVTDLVGGALQELGLSVVSQGDLYAAGGLPGPVPGAGQREGRKSRGQAVQGEGRRGEVRAEAGPLGQEGVAALTGVRAEPEGVVRVGVRLTAEEAGVRLARVRVVRVAGAPQAALKGGGEGGRLSEGRVLRNLSVTFQSTRCPPAREGRRPAAKAWRAALKAATNHFVQVLPGAWRRLTGCSP